MATSGGELARFEAVYARVRDPIGRYLARRVEPDALDDCFAEVLTVLWRRLAEVPPDLELAWCYGVARRVLANHRRASSRLARLVAGVGIDWEPAAPPVVYGSNPELRSALARLGATDAEIVRLTFWDGLAPREIALVLELSPNAVSIRLTRAKSRLRELLGVPAEGARPGRKDGGASGHRTSAERTEDRADG